MADESQTSTRTHIAVAIASASTTLAVGLTLAALGGYLGSAPAPATPASEPAPSRAEPTSAPASEPSIVLVPVERAEPPLDPEPFLAADERLAFVGEPEREHGHRSRRDYEEHEEDDDDD